MHKTAAVIAGAVRVLLKRLEAAPEVAPVRKLQQEALACLREAFDSPHPSTVESRDALMKRVLAIHLEARRLEGY